jgi:hypothetical protein
MVEEGVYPGQKWDPGRPGVLEKPESRENTQVILKRSEKMAEFIARSTVLYDRIIRYII